LLSGQPARAAPFATNGECPKHVTVYQHGSKNPARQALHATIVIAENPAQHCLCSPSRAPLWVNDRRQAEMERRFDIGDGARSRVRIWLSDGVHALQAS